MAKIPDWCKSEGLSNEELEKLCCPHGSFTCGLLARLWKRGLVGKEVRCNFCKEDERKKNEKRI